MGYVAVRGGQQAIEASLERLRFERVRGGAFPTAGAVRGGMARLVEQVMAEAGLYDEEAACLAAVQAEGSIEEAVFLLRAYRSTLARTHYTPVTDTSCLRVVRRVSAAFKDVPGGQVLGASPDYSHRLLDPRLWEQDPTETAEWVSRYLERERPEERIGSLSRVVDILEAQGLLAPLPPDTAPPRDVTRDTLVFPATRSERLQVLARGQAGAVTALGYAALRGFGAFSHPTVAELRAGFLPVLVSDGSPEDLDDACFAGEVLVTEVQTLVPVSLPRGHGMSSLRFEVGYGLCFGRNETKAIAMSIIEQRLRTPDSRFAVSDEEFVLTHVDPVEASGFISHLKLPHYVTFSSTLDAMRASRSGEAP
jgi:alpha-D-ribose 1-methylphosphonate 5-triphosphate synthase subunit PhnI